MKTSKLKMYTMTKDGILHKKIYVAPPLIEGKPATFKFDSKPLRDYPYDFQVDYRESILLKIRNVKHDISNKSNWSFRTDGESELKVLRTVIQPKWKNQLELFNEFCCDGIKFMEM